MSIVGKPAPTFDAEAAHQGDIVNIRLEDYRGQWVVLFFYPLDFTFVCPTEIVAFDGAREQFEAAGAQLLGCSVDSVHTHLAWMRTPRSEAGIGPISFPLISDLDKQIAASWGVLDGAKALRGVFVIDPDGIVQSATINNFSVGRNVEEVLRTLKAFQRVREIGDTCPANWHEGDAGMEESLAGVAARIG